MLQPRPAYHAASYGMKLTVFLCRETIYLINSKRMKKFFMLAVAAVFAVSATAANGFQDFGKLIRNANRQLKTVSLEKGGEVGTAVSKVKRQAAANAPESIVGKSFITVYNDTENKFNGFFNIVANGDKITLENFAEGFNVEATYDAATGTITIPTGVVVGTDQTYGDVTIHAITPDLKYNNTDITGTVNGNTITFDKGICGSVEAGLLIIMNEIKTTEANAKMSFTFNGTKMEEPLQVTKTADNTLSVVGINTLFLPGFFYNVPITFDATAKTAVIKSESPVGHNFSSNGTGVKNTFYFYTVESGMINSSTNPAFSVTTADNTSAITAKSSLFLGYLIDATGRYSGWVLDNLKFDVDFDILTQAVEEDPYADPTSATVDAITYSLDNDAKTAEVTGCLGSVTDLNIPSSITANGNVYTVTSVAETAFYANRTLKAVHMPASIKTVGKDAFRNLSNLKSLYIEDLAAWCAIEFANGNANPLYNVFPTSQSKWGNVYIGGVATTEVVVPEGVTKIGRSFYGFKAMTSITLPSTLKELGDQAFGNCINLTKVVIPESVEKTGSSFWGCTELTEINVPGSVKELGNSMFYGCKALKTITLAEGIESVGMMTFCNCSALEEITLPATMNSIGLMSFDECTGIKKITSLNTVPPTCLDDETFISFQTATLCVPEASVDAYKAATGWKVFTVVNGITPTGIGAIESDNASDKIEYYNLQGMKVAKENVTPGIYIIREGAKTTKAYINAK